MRPVTYKEADTLHKLTLTINKLKNRTTLNENMEMFAYFMELVRAKAPGLVPQVQPIVDEYISARGSVYLNQLMPGECNSMGYLPVEEKDNTEERLDMADVFAWEMENDPPPGYNDGKQQEPSPVIGPTVEKAGSPSVSVEEMKKKIEEVLDKKDPPLVPYHARSRNLMPCVMETMRGSACCSSSQQQIPGYQRPPDKIAHYCQSAQFLRKNICLIGWLSADMS